MKKPLIGIVPLVDEQRESLWMLPGYMDGVSQGGGVPVMLPLTDDPAALVRLTEACDGLLFTGGHDVSPSFYGEEALPVCQACCPARDRMEKVLLDLALASDKAVLGICRGIQFLNAALGGTLYQDLPTQRPSPVEHHMTPPYDQFGHSVFLPAGSPLERLLGLRELPVNSYHHQAVKALAPGLAAMGTAADGIVEAVYMPGKRFVWAVQWHPEFLWRVDENSRKLFATFVRAAGDR